jgi:hypothetical protein
MIERSDHTKTYWGRGHPTGASVKAFIRKRKIVIQHLRKHQFGDQRRLFSGAVNYWNDIDFLSSKIGLDEI